MTKPLSGQLEYLAKLLGATQECTPGGVLGPRRPSRDVWPTYLRVIDARDAGAPWSEIGKVFDCSVDAVRKQHERARELDYDFPL